jgi:DinB superfamily
VTTSAAATDLRYPVGRFHRPEAPLDETQRRRAIDAIAATPARLRAAVNGLTSTQLDTPYRPGGWTVRQVVHHVPDSHMNAYVRFKLALTEHEPTIKPYEEARWAELADTRETPIETSLVLLERLHERWVILLQSMSEGDFARRFHHPETGIQRLDQVLAMYEWHGAHHVGHVRGLRERMGW